MLYDYHWLEVLSDTLFLHVLEHDPVGLSQNLDLVNEDVSVVQDLVYSTTETSWCDM